MEKIQGEVLGVRYAGPLPRDARLTSLSLDPHPIFTAETDRFETREELLRATVKDDAVIIIEGEVGEFSVPDGLASFVSERAGLWPDAERSGPFSRSGLFENRGECHSGGRWPGHSRRPHGRTAHLYGGRPPLIHGAAMKEFVARLSGEIFYREDLTPALRVGTSADATLPLNRFPRSFRQCAVAHPLYYNNT